MKNYVTKELKTLRVMIKDPRQTECNKVVFLKPWVTQTMRMGRQGYAEWSQKLINSFFFFRLLPTRGRHSAIVISISLGLLHLLP